MRKIAVIGGVGAGKTTLALHLGQALDIEVTHLDLLFMGAGAGPNLRATCQSRLDVALAAPRYIIEGVYPWSYPQRIADCDTLIWLDIAPRVRFRGILGRGASRLWAHCTRQTPTGRRPTLFPALRFWRGFVVDWHENHALRAVTAAGSLDEKPPEFRLIRLQSWQEVAAFLTKARHEKGPVA